MDKAQKQALQAAKEIVVKFIEVGRVTPANFGEHFRDIYADILAAVRVSEAGAGDEDGQ